VHDVYLYASSLIGAPLNFRSPLIARYDAGYGDADEERTHSNQAED
jgi:hypothetical protein